MFGAARATDRERGRPSGQEQLRGLELMGYQAMTPTSIPVVDYRRNLTDRTHFSRSLFDALAGTGFCLLDNVDGLDDAFQQRCFEVAHRFFRLSTAAKMRYSLCDNPHLRGWGSPGGTALGGAAMVEAFQVGPDCEPIAPHDDRSYPLWQRMLRGPNVWPTEMDAPDFRSILEQLHARYFLLSRELGHVLCEAMGVDHVEYDRCVSTSHSFSQTAWYHR